MARRTSGPTQTKIADPAFVWKHKGDGKSSDGMVARLSCESRQGAGVMPQLWYKCATSQTDCILAVMATDSHDLSTESELLTSLPDIAVSVQGFGSQDTAQALGNGVIHLLHEVGRFIDISSLDGVTIAVDYDAALRDLDRGIEGLRPEERTKDGILTGVGKAILVKRADDVKTHLVFAAEALSCLALKEADSGLFYLALALIAHECAHVEEHARRNRQFPGTLLNEESLGFVPACLRQFSEAFWCEYAVCRASANFAPNEGDGFREALKLRLEPARREAREAIKAYRTHGDALRVFNEVGLAVIEPLRMASYLFGHLDGFSGDLTDVTIELPTNDQAFVAGITELVSQLRDLWDRRDHWESHDDMLVLGETAFDVLRLCGVDVQPSANGQAHIAVPITLDTIP